MTSPNEISLVGGVVHNLKLNGSWTGETHVQKTAYILKNTEKVPFESAFILYKHGPFSFELNGAINQMRAQNILKITPQGSYGSTIELNREFWLALNRVGAKIYDKYEQQIQFVCTKLAKKNVAELERIATAIYVYLNFHLASDQERARKLVELKPHIQLNDALSAVSEAETFTERLPKNVD